MTTCCRFEVVTFGWGMIRKSGNGFAAGIMPKSKRSRLLGPSLSRHFVQSNAFLRDAEAMQTSLKMALVSRLLSRS